MKTGRVLAIDYGLARIGLAISDEKGILASPLTTIYNKNDEKTIEALLAVIKKYQVKTIILGNPLGEDEQKTKMSDIIEKFCHTLTAMLKEDVIETNVIMWNEMLTSYQAYDNLLQKGYSHKKIKEQVDMEAARIILQEYLDH